MGRLIIAFTGLIAIGCSFVERENQKRNLNKAIVTLDKLLRDEQFNYKEVTKVLSSIDSNLENSEDKFFNNSLWQTQAKFKSNQDSTVVMIFSDKRHKDGFKRETILQIKDSVLLINRFEVLTDDKTKGYELLEIFDYLTRSKNIKTLVRREYPRPLSDTVYLRTLPFRPYEGEEGKQFAFELEYAKRIMNRN